MGLSAAPLFVTAAKAGVHISAGLDEGWSIFRRAERCGTAVWIPAFAGMTVWRIRGVTVEGAGRRDSPLRSSMLHFRYACLHAFVTDGADSLS